jgi:ubiquinone/menaquinone biosynthesis C-methylase UbiE
MTDKNKIRKLTDPVLILEKLEISQGFAVADFGCGSGYYTLPLAKLVGGQGKVFAIDVLESSLESVKSKTEIEGFLNIETIRANVENVKGSGLKAQSVDLVLMANLLYQAEKRSDIFKEAKRVLKKTGKLAVIEWNPDVEKKPLGPNYKIKFDKETVLREAESEGLKFEKEIEIDEYRYGLLFCK